MIENRNISWRVKPQYLYLNTRTKIYIVQSFHIDQLKVLRRISNDKYPFKRQSHKMIKHTQTIRRQFADELFWVCLTILWNWH